MKKRFLLLLAFVGCADRRHIPVSSTPVHILSTYDQVIASWGPALDCRYLQIYRYCEIDGKGIVVFQDNKYFTTIKKEKDASEIGVQILSANNLKISNAPRLRSNRISASFGRSSLNLKGKGWELNVNGSGKVPAIIPAMASAASDFLLSVQARAISKFKENSITVKSFSHYSHLIKQKSGPLQ